MRLIQETLREIVRFSKEDEEEFTCIVRSEIENRQSSEMKGQKTRLTACQKRLDELETLLCKIYEDNTLGKLPDRRYQILEAQYTKEQEALEAEIDSLQKEVDEYEQEQMLAIFRDKKKRPNKSSATTSTRRKCWSTGYRN